MKLFIRTLTFSLATLTIGTHVHAAMKNDPTKIQYGYTKTSVDFAKQVARWYKSNNYSELEKFCINNPIFQWIEDKLEIKKWDDPKIGNFWKEIKIYIWKNDQHRINSFVELICFLTERIEKEFALYSPKADKKQLMVELQNIKEDPHYTEEHFKYYETQIKDKSNLIKDSTNYEITYLQLDDFSSYWKTMIKKTFRININLKNKDTDALLEEISIWAQQILNSIFMYDPTFK